VRDVPVERITDVLSDLVYGTMFTNYFTGQRKPFDAQVQDLLDIVFFGILSGSEREGLGPDESSGRIASPSRPPHGSCHA
jgi:hypothetical protein